MSRMSWRVRDAKIRIQNRNKKLKKNSTKKRCSENNSANSKYHEGFS